MRNISWDKAPVQRMVPHLRDYVEYGVPPGDFLTALLSNNLIDTIGKADEENEANIKGWVRFVYWELPSGCHGSVEKMKNWMIARRAESREDMKDER